LQFGRLKRREIIALLGGAAALQHPCSRAEEQYVYCLNSSVRHFSRHGVLAGEARTKCANFVRNAEIMRIIRITASF
jgi:hypothetical protein